MDYPVEKIMNISKIAVASKMFPGMSVEAVAMIGIVAHDLNLPLSTALMGGINIIQGKPSLSARVMNLLIRRAGHSLNVEHTADSCTIIGKRKDNGDEAKVSFTLEDAKAAGLLNKDNWKKHTADMLFSRALSRISRQLFPDCIEGAYVEGEIEQNDTKLETIEIPAVIEEPVITEDQLAIITAKTDLLPKDSVEKILKAKGWASFAEMKQKQYPSCIQYLEQEIKKELQKELSTTAPWESQ